MIRVLHLNPTKGWRGGEQQTLYLSQFLKTQKDVQQYVCCYPNSVLEDRCKKRRNCCFSVKGVGRMGYILCQSIV